MPIILTAYEFQKQFGSSIGNQIVGKPKKIAQEKPAKAQIRIPRKREPNKTEAEWMQICRDDNRSNCGARVVAVLFEPFTLNLPSGTRYTPDVVLVETADIGISVTCYEVKGAFIHNQRSIHAFKEARAAFPWMSFVFTQKGKDGQWRTAE